jgi:hypothetical protein
MRRGCPEGDCVSPSRLELLGALPPMAPGEDCPTPPKNQPPAKVAKFPWHTRRARRPRRRVCLLKGCGRVFRPRQPLARYCSEACREQARRWRQWKARRRYRRSPNGQQRRQAQSRRYRERRKERSAREIASLNRCEGHPYKIFLRSWVVLLRPRPGCYVAFQLTKRSLGQRFCSLACRRAVERVRERERHWRQRRFGPKGAGALGKKAWPLRP